MRKLCDKTWFIQKYKQQEFWSNKYPHKFSIHWIRSTPSVLSNAAADTQILVFQTKNWSYHWSKIVPGDWVKQIRFYVCLC